MKEIEIFYLTGCPYCKSARKAVEELTAENDYTGLSLRWIEERENKALADSRDYYYVPTVYYKGKKLYECSPAHSYADIKARFKAAFDAVSASAEP